MLIPLRLLCDSRPLGLPSRPRPVRLVPSVSSLGRASVAIAPASTPRGGAQRDDGVGDDDLALRQRFAEALGEHLASLVMAELKPKAATWAREYMQAQAQEAATLWSLVDGDPT